MDFADTFPGKTALVTGASSGIGKAIAIGLGKAGAHVICVSRSRSRAGHTARVIQEQGGSSCAAALDVTDPAATATFFEQIDKSGESIAFAYLNAGGHQDLSSIVDSDVEAWQADVTLNMFSVFYGIRYLAPLMKKAGGGRIIFTGSALAHEVHPGNSAYCSSKAGARMIARVAARELAADNITVNELVPGPVLTPLTAARHQVDDKDNPAFGNPVEWIKAPEDVVALALSIAALPGKGPTGQTFSLARR